jgi:hypothetical protein
MPNRISGKTTLAYRKRTLASTKPLAQPSSDEIRLAGMDRLRLLRKLAESFGHTSVKFASEKLLGSEKMLVTETSAGSLKAVTSSTYTGMRKKATSSHRPA